MMSYVDFETRDPMLLNHGFCRCKPEDGDGISAIPWAFEGL